jgi:hypothetical protein
LFRLSHASACGVVAGEVVIGVYDRDARETKSRHAVKARRLIASDD